MVLLSRFPAVVWLAATLVALGCDGSPSTSPDVSLADATPRLPLGYADIRGVNFKEGWAPSWGNQWGPGEYDAERVEQYMQRAQSLGANLVMAFLEGDQGDDRYRAAMLAHLDDFLARADQHGLRALIALSPLYELVPPPTGSGTGDPDGWLRYVLTTAPYDFAHDPRVWGWTLWVEASKNNASLFRDRFGHDFCTWIRDRAAQVRAVDTLHPLGLEYFGNTTAELEQNLPLCGDPGLDFFGLSLNWPDGAQIVEGSFGGHLDHARGLVDRVLGPGKGLVITQTGTYTSWSVPWTGAQLAPDRWDATGAIDVVCGGCGPDPRFVLAASGKGDARAVSTAWARGGAEAQLRVRTSAGPASANGLFGLASEATTGATRFAGFRVTPAGVACEWGADGQPATTVCSAEAQPGDAYAAQARYLTDVGYDAGFVSGAIAEEQRCISSCGSTESACVNACALPWLIAHSTAPSVPFIAADMSSGMGTFVRGDDYRVRWDASGLSWYRNQHLLAHVPAASLGADKLHAIIASHDAPLEIRNVALEPTPTSTDGNNPGENEQAGILADRLSTARAHGVGAVIWQLEDTGVRVETATERFWGLVRGDGGHKPGWTAVQNAWR